MANTQKYTIYNGKCTQHVKHDFWYKIRSQRTFCFWEACEILCDWDFVVLEEFHFENLSKFHYRCSTRCACGVSMENNGNTVEFRLSIFDFLCDVFLMKRLRNNKYLNSYIWNSHNFVMDRFLRKSQTFLVIKNDRTHSLNCRKNS